MLKRLKNAWDYLFYKTPSGSAMASHPHRKYYTSTTASRRAERKRNTRWFWVSVNPLRSFKGETYCVSNNHIKRKAREGMARWKHGWRPWSYRYQKAQLMRERDERLARI